MWKVHLENLLRVGRLGYRMYVLHESPGMSPAVMHGPFTMHALEQGAFIPEDKAFLDDVKLYGYDVREFLQAMSDAAWEIGIRPKGLEGHTDELKAVRYHLEDMRMLVLQPPPFALGGDK